MNKYLVKGMNENKDDFEVEVLAENEEDALDIVDDDTVEEIKSITKVPMYNVGDKVVYMNLHKERHIGTVTKVEETDIHEWNKDKGTKFLYSLKEYPYSRYEEEIIRTYGNKI